MCESIYEYSFPVQIHTVRSTCDTGEGTSFVRSSSYNGYKKERI